MRKLLRPRSLPASCDAVPRRQPSFASPAFLSLRGVICNVYSHPPRTKLINLQVPIFAQSLAPEVMITCRHLAYGYLTGALTITSSEPASCPPLNPELLLQFVSFYPPEPRLSGFTPSWWSFPSVPHQGWQIHSTAFPAAGKRLRTTVRPPLSASMLPFEHFPGISPGVPRSPFLRYFPKTP